MAQARGGGATLRVVGVAGIDRDDEAEVIRGIMHRIGAKARVVVTNDALVAQVAGAGSGPGIVVTAGTGSIACGQHGRGRDAPAGGWGDLLRDEAASRLPVYVS